MKIKQVLFLLIILASPASFAQSSGQDWTIFRGRTELSGNTITELPSNPSLLWSLPSNSRTKSSPVISDGMIYFGNDKGMLIAAGTDGKIKWEYQGGSAAEAPPMVYGDKVIIGLNDGTLHAVNKTTGRVVWKYNTEGQIAGSANAWSTGKRSGIVIGSYDYYLHSVDPANGLLQWRLETLNYVNGTPAVSNNNIIFGGCDGFIRVVDAYTGREKDTIEIGTYIASSPALSGGRACFGDYDGNFFCLDLLSGKLAWEIPANETSMSFVAIPAMGRNSVVIGNEDKYLYCYDIITGRLNWKFRTNGRITGSAVITPSKVIFGSTDGNIYILNLSDGKKVWSFNAGGPISSSPAVMHDRFYFLTDDGRLLSFGKK
ncbi:MAG: PQQ-binding-like beta-propeller repeat protein [Bacteroidales bacterium]|jgi:outer membrane protein assembly factor BamB|nr:PQQ-binding-like beta-propeller repeat protein [Bacteroidales bacterium]